MDIALPESLEPIVRRRVEEGGFSSVDEYVRALVLADLNRAVVEPAEYPVLSPGTQALIQEGLDSGPGVVADETFWSERHRRLAEGRAGV